MLWAMGQLDSNVQSPTAEPRRALQAEAQHLVVAAHVAR
jgi:hypothetical protein